MFQPKKKKDKSYLWKIAIAIGIILFIVMLIFSVAAENITDNLTCAGTSCALNQNYTYDANLKDPNCWYKINFCNVDINVNKTLTRVDDVVILLKQVNYQQQADVAMYKSKYETDRISMYVIIGFVIIVAIWNIYLLSRIRRLKNDKS